MNFKLILIILNSILVSGHTSLERQPRIWHGKVAKLGQFPYQALVLITMKYEITYCGASVLNKNYVITAAHCVENKSFKDIFVYFGVIWRTNLNHATYRTVDHVKIHEKFDLSKFSNDVALIKLSKPLTFDKTIQPVILPDSKIDLANKLVTLSGWGIYDNSLDYSDVLRYAKAKVMDDKKCKKALANHDIPLKGVLCHSSLDFNDGPTCSGDSGGPVVLNGTSVLVGVISFGIDCGYGEDSSYSMRVPHYVDWIKKHMKT